MKLFSALPALALVYLPMLLGEINTSWPDFYDPAVMAGQIEQETCISLTHRMCWNPRAELKTSREYGFGLGQLTVAYTKDGKVRFSAFEEVKQYDAALAAWEWRDRYSAPMQIKAFVLKNRVNWNSITFAASDDNRAKFMLYGYNGGMGSVFKDKRLCDRTPGCDSGYWFGHMEITSTKSKTPFGGVYGNQSPHSITRRYVREIMTVRADRYREKIDEITAQFPKN